MRGGGAILGRQKTSQDSRIPKKNESGPKNSMPGRLVLNASLNLNLENGNSVADGWPSAPALSLPSCPSPPLLPYPFHYPSLPAALPHFSVSLSRALSVSLSLARSLILPSGVSTQHRLWGDEPLSLARLPADLNYLQTERHGLLAKKTMSVQHA